MDLLLIRETFDQIAMKNQIKKKRKEGKYRDPGNEIQINPKINK